MRKRIDATRAELSNQLIKQDQAAAKQRIPAHSQVQLTTPESLLRVALSPEMAAEFELSEDGEYPKAGGTE